MRIQLTDNGQWFETDRATRVSVSRREWGGVTLYYTASGVWVRVDWTARDYGEDIYRIISDQDAAALLSGHDNLTQLPWVSSRLIKALRRIEPLIAALEVGV